MPELNLKQIVDKLNAEFTGETRKLVFWYDEHAEFVEDITSLKLDRAQVYVLEPDNQFRTKIFLEREDTETSYLLYAPFPKPAIRDNHLEDMLRYSKRFYADRASLLTVDLGIDEQYKPIIQRYIKFFASKERERKFYSLEMEQFTKETIEVALLSVLCKARTVTFDEVLRVVMTEDELENNRFLNEFEKFDLTTIFWQHCEREYGYSDAKPTLEKLVATLFVTYTERYLRQELPQAWRSFVSLRQGNVIVFMDHFMNSFLYHERYDELSAAASSMLNVSGAISKLDYGTLLDCDSFAEIDQLLLNWIMERLLDEDTGAKLREWDIPKICLERGKKHFGTRFKVQYSMLASAYEVIVAANYACSDDLKSLIAQYQQKDYQIDAHYRHFYFLYDQLTDTSGYEKLRDLIENIYTNEYLAKQMPMWTSSFASDAAMSNLPLQRHFYGRYVESSKSKVVVIVSDALRYEVGQQLFQKLERDPNCETKMEAMMGILPSFTRLGMASLLPHKQLELTDEGKVLVDGLPSDNLQQREEILQKSIPNSRCVQYDDVKQLKKAELRELFTGMDVVYVYHNQIDARGDKLNTENEVFNACEEAIEEIYTLIKRLSVNANTYHFVVTADHGFLYKRDKLMEYDKISGVGVKGAYVNRRFIVTQDAIQEDGVSSDILGRMLGNDDNRYVSFPVSTNVFKVAGGGQNYVHGGCSPQELLLPVIDVKTERGHVETQPASIALVSMVHKITNLITSLDFIQTEPVSSVVKETGYKLFFVSEENERISNECNYMADRKDNDPQKRMFRLRFDFKNQRYHRNKRYHLIALNEKNGLEVFRHDVVIDIAFANDFGF